MTPEQLARGRVSQAADCDSGGRRLISLSDDELSVVRTARALSERVRHLRALGCHVLALGGRTSALSQSFGVSFEDVWVDPDPDVRECYADPALMRPDERAVVASSLARIAIAAGIVWLPAPADIGTVPNLWRYRAQGALIGYDGTPQTISGTAEVDLRDGSAQIGGWTPSKWRGLAMRNSKLLKRSPKAATQQSIHGWDDKRVLEARRRGCRIAETKAKSAAVRTLGVRSTYTVDELAKPFVVCRVIYLPNMDDPKVREMVTDRALDGAARLYRWPVAPLAASTPEADPGPTDPLRREEFPL